MTRHHKRTRRNRRGGFWPFSSSETSTPSYVAPTSTYSATSSNGIGSTLSNTWSNISEGASSLWNKAKKTVSGNNSMPSYQAPPPAPAASGYMGGRRHRKRGGTKGWTPLNNVASHAADFSGKSAMPQAWVGGKRTKRRSRKTTRRRRGTRRH